MKRPIIVKGQVYKIESHRGYFYRNEYKRAVIYDIITDVIKYEQSNSFRVLEITYDLDKDEVDNGTYKQTLYEKTPKYISIRDIVKGTLYSSNSYFGRPMLVTDDIEKETIRDAIKEFIDRSFIIDESKHEKI